MCVHDSLVVNDDCPPSSHSYWRIFSGLHTAAQIGVGAGVGGAVGWLWQGVCQTELNGRLGAVLKAHYVDGLVPLSYIAGVMVLGAMTVGSVERKIGGWLKKLTGQGKASGKAA
jgi:hypothetical protein